MRTEKIGLISTYNPQTKPSNTNDYTVEGFVQCYENEWVMNIADLVVTDQLVSNDGTKLLKVRF